MWTDWAVKMRITAPLQSAHFIKKTPVHWTSKAAENEMCIVNFAYVLNAWLGLTENTFHFQFQSACASSFVKSSENEGKITKI